MQNSATRPNVAKASGIVILSVLASRVLGMVRDTVMATLFGSNALTDAYGLSFLIPDIFSYLLISGALSSAFIPVFSEYFHTDKKEESWKIFSSVTLILSFAMVVLLGLTWVFMEPLAQIAIGGKSAETGFLVTHMSRILLPAQFAFMLGGLMFATLYARQQFVTPGISFSVYNLGILFGAICISHFVYPGIVGMAWGALLGAYVGNVVIPIWAMRKIGSSFHFRIDLQHPGTRKVFRLMLPVIFGLSLPYLYMMIARYLGSFYQDGIVTSLDLSNKLMQLPLGIFGQSLALAMFPALTQFFAQQRMDLFRDQLARTLRTVLYITLPISMMMIILSQDIITALLQYGKFKTENTVIVAECLQMFAIGISAWCVQPVLMRGFYAIHNTFTPFVLSTLATLAFGFFAAGLGQTSLGYLGIPLAASLTLILFMNITLYVLNKKVKALDIEGILSTFTKCLFATLLMGIFLWAGARFLPTGEGMMRNMWAFIRLSVLGLTGAWIYYGTTRLLNIEESRVFDRVFQRLNRLVKSPSPKQIEVSSPHSITLKEEVRN